MKNYYFENLDLSALNWQKRLFLLLCFMVFGIGTSQAQIGVTVTNPSNTTPALAASYISFAAALTDLNSVSAMTGPVTLTLGAGSETTPATGLILGSATLNPVLSSTNTITIFATPSTAVLNAGVGGVGTPATAVQDGILKLVGADYVTIDGLTFTDGNVANPDTMESGVALFKASATDGANNNTIQNCTFNMQRINNVAGVTPMFDGSVGILVINAIPTATTTVLAVTDANGSNSNNKFYANTINGANCGIGLSGFAATTPFTLGDTNNDVGGLALGTGNSVLNFGGGATTSPSAGIRTTNQWGLNVSYNTVNNNNGSGVNHATTLRGIFIGAATSASVNINNNIVTVQSGATTSLLEGIDNASGSTAASNTININNNTIRFAYATATTGIVNGILNSGSATTFNANNNSVESIAAGVLAGTGTWLMIDTGSPVNAFTNNNSIANITRTGASGTLRGIKTTSPTNWTVNGNTIENLSYSAVASTGNIDGIYGLSSSVNVTANNNVVRNLSTPTTGTINGIREFGVPGTKIFQNNQIYNFSTTAGGAGGAIFNGLSMSTGDNTISNNLVYSLNSTGTTGGTGGSVTGIRISGGGTNQILKNKIYDLSSASTGPVVSGILVSGGTTTTTANNIIGDLRATAANTANPLIGINITGGTTSNVYNNTVLLNGSSSGALFGSSAVSTATGTTVALRNNIFANNSTPTGAGLSVAYRRSSTTLASYDAASNNNLFYASNIFTDGTNTDATLAAYKSRVASRDALSVSENPNFVSTVGSNSNFLHIDTTIATQIESGGATVAAVTDDFDGDVRNGSTPDIGADEFAGIPISVVVINSVAINPVGNQCTAVERTITANITAGGNDITSVTLNYSFDGVAQTPITMTGGTLTAGSTSTFSATIPVASPVNANVTWNVAAVDPVTSKSSSGPSYQDEPLFGSTAAANASITPLCSGGSTVLSATLVKNGTKNVGSGSLTTTGSGTSSTNYVSPFTHWYGGYKAQYIVRASELTALGFAAGNNLTSLAFDVTTASTVNYTGFTLRMGTTPATAMTTTFDTSSLTQVYTGDLAVSATGLLTLPFGTGAGSSASYTWDGTSNVLINLCWSNNNTGGAIPGSAEVKYDSTSFAAMAYYRVDNATQATVCGVTTATATSSNRPKMVFGGNLAPAITSISWSDGSTVVGTGNNLSVSPTANTSYTATLTAAGCTIDTNTVAVAVTTVDNTVNQSLEVLTANQAGATYQWFSCPGNVAISGETGQSYTATANGDYGVTVTLSGCPVNSNCVTVSTLGVNTFDFANGFKIYPNPVNNILNIEYANELTNVSVYNLLGQQVLTKNVNATSTQIDMSGLNAETYLVKISSENASKTIKVVKR